MCCRGCSGRAAPAAATARAAERRRAVALAVPKQRLRSRPLLPRFRPRQMFPVPAAPRGCPMCALCACVPPTGPRPGVQMRRQRRQARARGFRRRRGRSWRRRRSRRTRRRTAPRCVWRTGAITSHAGLSTRRVSCRLAYGNAPCDIHADGVARALVGGVLLRGCAVARGAAGEADDVSAARCAALLGAHGARERALRRARRVRLVRKMRRGEQAAGRTRDGTERRSAAGDAAATKGRKKRVR